jgi:hypothetical protein
MAMLPRLTALPKIICRNIEIEPPDVRPPSGDGKRSAA